MDTVQLPWFGGLKVVLRFRIACDIACIQAYISSSF